MVRNIHKPRPQYLLKHRLTGAAILIATAVLVIPLLLTEQGIQASSDSRPVTEQAQEAEIFQSKIVPLNLKSLNFSTKKSKDDDELKPALLVTREVKSAEPVGLESPEAAQDQKKKKKEKAQPEKQEVVLTVDMQEESSTTASSEAIQSRESEEDDIATNTEEKSIKADTTRDNSWTVRVGTFTKIENVESVFELLQKSGFIPRRTSVTTNFGPATRVWLGPYDDKESAKKVSTRLKTLTGEEGYVTRRSAS